MTTAAPVSGTASTVVLDPDRPEVELRPLERGDAAAAEVAVAVVDAWQRHGWGTVLLAALARRAGELGVRRFHGDVSFDNVAVLQVLRRTRARWSLVHVGGGVSRLVLAPGGAP